MKTQLAAPTDQPENNPLALLGQMDLSKIEPEKIEQLLTLQERWEDRQAQKAFAEALHKFQAECPQISRSSKGHNSRYAKYEDLQKVIRPHMQANGFSANFDTQTNESGEICAVICTLHHLGGHSVTSRFPVLPDSSGSKNAIQAIGSALSYGMRYSTGAVLGLVFTDEDDDGHAASAQGPVDQATGDEINGLLAEIEEISPGSKERFLKWVGVSSPYEIPANRADEAMRMLNKKLKEVTQ